jgi:hypothetical protein
MTRKLGRFCHACHTLGSIPLALTAILTLTLGSQVLRAQGSFKRTVHVTVTDPLDRFVTGLGPENFGILENGLNRPISGFSGVDAPITIAIVSQTPLPSAGRFNSPEDELIQTQSISAALRQLSASTNARKVLIVTTGEASQAISQDIQVLQMNSDNLVRAVIELHNQYVLQFDSAVRYANIEVQLRQPRGFPPLRTSWK